MLPVMVYRSILSWVSISLTCLLCAHMAVLVVLNVSMTVAVQSIAVLAPHIEPASFFMNQLQKVTCLEIVDKFEDT